MPSLNSSFSDLPSFFRKELYTEIFSLSDNAKNLQLVGLKGFGKSLSLRLLESNQDKIKKNIGVKSNTLIYLSDLDLLPDASIGTFVKFVFGRVLGIQEIYGLDSAETVLKLQEFFNQLKKDKRKIIVILDTFERLTFIKNPEIFSFLNGLYKTNSDVLSYVFSMDKEVDPGEVRSKFGDLGRLFLEKTIFFTPLSKIEQEWFFDSLAQMGEVNISGADRKRILEAAGGYMVAIKRLIEASMQGTKARMIIAEPQLHSGLYYNLESIYEEVSSFSEFLKKLIFEPDKLDEPIPDALVKYGILDSKGHFISPLFEFFLRQKFADPKDTYKEVIGNLKVSVRLTSGEYKIVKFLASRMGEICTRDEIIETVWGQKADSGISDHALDQIMSRLRRKLSLSNEKLKVETVRGRGHRLIGGIK